MQNQVMIIAIAVVALAAAGGSGYYAWQQHAELQRANAELATTRASLARSSADLRAAREQVTAMQKDLDEQKGIAEMARADRDSARNLLAAEVTQGERVRAELQLMREQLAFVRGRQSPAQYAPPSVVQPRPMVIRAAPAGHAAVKAASAAA